MFVPKFLPAALGLWIGLASESARGQEGPTAPKAAALHSQKDADLSFNQRMASAIAERLQRSGRLRGFRVDIRFADGSAELSGRVADSAQRDAVVWLVQTLPGVERVRDLLEVGGSRVVLTAQEQKVEQGPIPDLFPITKDKAGADGKGKSALDKTLQPPATGGVFQEPKSIMPDMPGFNPAYPGPVAQPPPMPPYAWPTYAPYNNYSRVAYPNLYPHEAFPFVGPMYPFPKVPLGWRAVTLRWQDGHWWYGKEATGHDWWRIRYW